MWKTVRNLTIFYQYGANLYDLTGQRRKTCCLNIKDHKSTVQLLTFPLVTIPFKSSTR